MKKKITSYFNQHPTSGIRSSQLRKKLRLTKPHEIEKFKAVLFQLLEEDFLFKRGKRYFLNPTTTKNLEGMIFINDDSSFGFVRLKNSKLKDIFIPGKYLANAFHGDTVSVSLLAQRKGKNLEGKIVAIIKRKRKEIVGTLKKSNSFYFVHPDETKIHRDIYVHKTNLNGAKDGSKVIVNEIIWDDPKLNPEGKIKFVIGKAGDHNSELVALAIEYNLPLDFPDKVKSELRNIKLNISDSEIKNRLDLRNEIVFTIDPEDAKDFDDALSIKKLSNGNYLVGIHIADVSHYIEKDTALFEEALNRGTSVYLVGNVIPMLPEKISNKICSLVPREDRLTFSVICELTPRGKIIEYKITKSVINSKKRFTYSEAQNIIDNRAGQYFDELFMLNKLAKNLKANRSRQGSINFHSSEPKIVLDKSGKVLKITNRIALQANSLVEEFMLLANKLVCKHVSNHKEKFTFIYRVHDKPNPEKLIEFEKFVKTLGYNFDASDVANPKQFQTLLKQVENSAEEAVVNEVAIRSMSKAIYSDINIGHFGLGFKFYTHFTSPIRRFPDLIVHKLLFDFIKNNRNTNFSVNQIKYYCEHSSAQERNAIEAERLSIRLKQIEYLNSKLGEDFPGIISGVTNFGLFIQLSDILADGLVKINDIDDDYYFYDEKNYLLKGRSTGKVFRLGYKVQVKIIRVDKLKREIDFLLV